MSTDSIDRYPYPLDESEDWQPFMKGIARLEKWLADAVAEHTGTVEEKADYAREISELGSSVSSAAHRYDFARSTPELMHTSAVGRSGQNLADVMRNPAVPPGITAIYQELYPAILDEFPAQEPPPAPEA